MKTRQTGRFPHTWWLNEGEEDALDALLVLIGTADGTNPNRSDVVRRGLVLLAEAYDTSFPSRVRPRPEQGARLSA